ncbi:hypothetical protein D9Q98_005958 [Chlorella vulgaris]|uniref:Little elongation complex subunit 2 C-terminal domain-containing protein n=1 Tax=Chlorella vulgaris TaxID=3077 RepID=A0A9D4TWS3_CHLVU|nr:hypothetical protein D9Q98_005958 [Chlorella vulgaris]
MAGFRQHSQLGWCLAQRDAERQRHAQRRQAQRESIEQEKQLLGAGEPAAMEQGAGAGAGAVEGIQEAVLPARLAQGPTAADQGLVLDLAGDPDAATEPAAAAAAAAAAAVTAAAKQAAAGGEGKPANARVRREQRQGRRQRTQEEAAEDEASGVVAADAAAAGRVLPPPTLNGLQEVVGQWKEADEEQADEEAADSQEEQQQEDAAAAAEGLHESPGKRKRPPAQQAAMEAALAQLGESSWQEFCKKLLAAAERGDAATAGRGRGRGGKAGRGKGRGGAAVAAGAAQPAVGIQDVLNRKSRVYHEGFAAAYNDARGRLEKKDFKRQNKEVLQEHSRLLSRWSDLSAQEHAWYLAHQGKALAGSDAHRWELLQQRVAQEQQQYYEHIQEKASQERYLFCSDRQFSQLEEDGRRRRDRVQQQLPRCYRLREVVPVPQALPPAAQGGGMQAEAPQLQHLATLRREGQLPLFVQPANNSPIHGDKIYLPASITAAHGGGGAGGGEPAVASATGAASNRKGEYRKEAVPLLSQDPLLAPMVLQAAQQPGPYVEAVHEAAATAEPVFAISASAFSAIVSTPLLMRTPAWEIPITIQPAAAEGGQVVCLEKPLAQRLLPLRAKQQRLQKYAVLSLGVQQQQVQHQAEQQQQQPDVPRRSTRGAAAAAAASAPSPPSAAKPVVAAGGPQPREAAYDCWQLGDCRLLLRSHGRMQLKAQQQEQQQEEQQEQQQEEQQQEQQGQHEQQQAAPACSNGRAESPSPPPPPAPPAGAAAEEDAQHVVVAVTTEYLPETDLEETTLEELWRWWLKLLLQPIVDSVLVAHVHVLKGKLMCCETLTAPAIEQLLSGEGSAPAEAAAVIRRLAASGLAFLQQLLALLREQSPGQYLLTHSPGDPSCCLYRALPREMEEALGAQEAPPPLPCSATVARQGTVYDLHAAHQRSGSTDKAAQGFLPPRWRAFDPQLPQVPHTFPPRTGHAGRKQYAKARQHKAVPYAWQVMGHGGDFDQVGHVAQISKTDYMQGVEDGL